MADSLEYVTGLDRGAWLHVAERRGHRQIVRVNLGDARGQGFDGTCWSCSRSISCAVLKFTFDIRSGGGVCLKGVSEIAVF